MSESASCETSPRPWILVLDMTEYVARICKHAAEERNLDCTIAQQVPEAFGMVYAKKPAAIFASTALPTMSGCAFIAGLAASRTHRAIPIAALVTSQDAHDEVAAYAPTTTIACDDELEARIGEFLDSLELTTRVEATAPQTGLQASPRVLLAEDSPTNQLLLARILHVAGADVTVVKDGQEALDMADEDLFDLILMDIEMPVMDGLEAATHLRAKGIELPIIAVTGHEEEAVSSEEFDENFDGFLQKPVSTADVRNLFRLYRRHLRRRAA